MDDRLTEPLDELHSACIVARMRIRARFDHAKWVAATWTPRPCPKR